MKLYDDLASWWQLLSPPFEYEDEAAIYARTLLQFGDAPARTMLELGSGGGNNASHLKKHFAMTLADRSRAMLDVSRALNPDCEHFEGDMRSIRLGRQFDRVFIHDAIVYMTTRDDLRKAVETAYVHCRPGGAALFVPDHVRETFRPMTDHGGFDGDDGRALRYLEWSWDPDPDDDTYTVDYAYILRDADGRARAVHDRHVEGLFARNVWLETLAEAGFQPHGVPLDYERIGAYDAFAGVKG